MSYICSAKSENLRNLEIGQMYCAIPRSRNYSAQSRDSENAQHNHLEIAQHNHLEIAQHNHLEIAQHNHLENAQHNHLEIAQHNHLEIAQILRLCRTHTCVRQIILQIPICLLLQYNLPSCTGLSSTWGRGSLAP